MKSRNIITVLILLFGFSVISAQEQTKIPDGISIAFKAGNATELAKYMNSTVELLLLDKEDFYKKNVAESILQEFFGAQKIEDFNIRHQGARNEAQYAIGTLTTENGDYRVYFLLKKIDSKQLIHQIRIEIEDER